MPAPFIKRGKTDMKKINIRLAGAAAGLINGLFGGGGGTVLVPLLNRWGGMKPKQVFATCVAVIFPACLVSAGIYFLYHHLDWRQALPYLVGGGIGGLVGGLTFEKVPLRWLRILFALFLLYGGVRYLV